MKIDTRFATKLDSMFDAPEPFFYALQDNLPSHKNQLVC
jgi:hypothetical protein